MMFPHDAVLDRFRTDLALLILPPLRERRLGLAVSGGPDSLALLLLAHAAFPGAIAAATVDHGLRAEAADEARHVAHLCQGLGVPHTILVRAADGGTADPVLELASAGREGSQSWARALRYALLGQWCAAQAIGRVATGHHADDQAETFLMRAAHGSGLGGLAGIRATTPLPLDNAGRMLVRPLLGWRRAELGAIVHAACWEAADDPSNASPAYDRTAFRELLHKTTLLRPERIAATATHLGEAEAAMAWMADRLWHERARIAEGAAILLDVTDVPRELRRRMLQRALDHLHGRSGGYRLDTLDRLLSRLDRGESGTIGRFLARPGPPWRITPAPPRRA